MAPKVKKSGILWLSCDSCGSTFSAKDSVNHPNVCPPPLDNWEHGFIRDCVLHASLHDIDNKGSNAKVPPDFLEKVVLLSQSAMQLCNFMIGDYVQIKCGNMIAFRRAWPTSEGSLADVYLVKEDLEFEWGKQIPSSQASISKISRPPQLPRRICYKIKNLTSDLNNELFANILRGKTAGIILYTGMCFQTPFYGRQLGISVSRIEPIIGVHSCSEADDLAESMTNLKINDIDIFTPCDSTEWVQEFENDENRRKESKKENLGKIGGFDGIVSNVKKNIDLTLLTPHRIGKGSVCFGVLLYGVHGVGKTLLAKHLCTMWDVPNFEIKAMELFGKSFGETESKLLAAFELAKHKAPCIVTIDNIELLCPKKGTDVERRISSLLVGFFDSIYDKQIVVIATSAQPHDIDPAIRMPGRLESELEIEIPSPAIRLDILKALVPNAAQLLSPLQSLAQATHGFVGADLASVISKAIGISCSESKDHLTEDHLCAALRLVKPSAMREVYVQVPNVRWSDIGGQEDLKLKLQQAVEWPVKYPDKFKQLGIRPPRGVLMYGPPGCSKTLAAKALANESKINFLSVKGSDIFSKWVGESERAVRDIFKRARAVAPAIVFLDELDALGGERGDGASGQGGCAVQERVLSQLLTELDGVQPLENVIILAATNRPDKIDKALLRPGRLDRLIYVPLPSLETRKKIFAYKFGKMPVEANIDVDHLAQETNGYSGAEIVNICHDAAYNALEENLDAVTVCRHNFLAALTTNKPRTPSSLLNLYKNYQTSRC